MNRNMVIVIFSILFVLLCSLSAVAASDLNSTDSIANKITNDEITKTTDDTLTINDEVAVDMPNEEDALSEHDTNNDEKNVDSTLSTQTNQSSECDDGKLQKDGMHYGYWVHSGDMADINLSDLEEKGVSDLFLNQYSFVRYENQSGFVESWIGDANSHGIKIHIWAQIFYMKGWINPINITTHEVNQKYFDEKIASLERYARTPGVAGIHYDYLRYSGSVKYNNSAAQNPGGMEAITLFVNQSTAALRAINPDLILSAAIMPEPEHPIDWYGYDYPAISHFMDVMIPMIYTGNYRQNSGWVENTTRWFVENSQHAEVWTGLQGYTVNDVEEEIRSNSPISQMSIETNSALAGGSKGAIVFRFGASNDIDFVNPPIYDYEFSTFNNLDYVISCSKNLAILDRDYTFNSTHDSGYVNGIGIHTDNLVIDGAGHTIDGKNLARMFNVTGTNITFKNINFINGFTENKGGALYITGKASNIINCTFKNNMAADKDRKNAEAGAVFLQSANAIIKDSKFINSSAVYNGALLVRGNYTTIDNCFFKDNFADISAGAVGWGRRENGIIKNSVFINNSAVDEGGGALFFNNAHNCKIINSTFANNTGKPDAGAIFTKNSTNFQISDSTFEANNATGKGGAIYWFGGDGTIQDSTFNSNYADEDGGAIYLRVGNGIIKDSNFTNNRAYYNGAVYLNSIQGTVYKCTFTNNTATDSAGALGWVKKENGTIAYCRFTDNSAPRGGALYLNNGTEFYIRNSVFVNNNASKHGGAIFWDSGNEGRLIGCEFENNTAGELGGAVCWNNTQNGYIAHGRFIKNQAHEGGAIYLGESNMTITYSSFQDNTATSGGAIYNNGTISVKGNSFTNNSAEDGSNDTGGPGKIKYNVGFEIDCTDNVYGKTAKITVRLTNDDEMINNGTLSLIVNNITYEAEVKNATATVEIPNLNAGSYDVNITYAGDSIYNSHTEIYSLIISKQDSTITGKDKSFIINYGGKYTVTVKGLSGAKVIFRLNYRIIGSAITDKNGVASISLTSKMLKTAEAGKRNLKVTLNNKNYQAVKTFKITINKEKTKITAKAKSFKKSVKTKKYTIYLKNSKGKAVKKAKVSLKIKGKTYNAKTNSKGKATFKIKKLTKKGKHSAKISFKENACYKSSSKKVKIRVK